MKILKIKFSVFSTLRNEQFANAATTVLQALQSNPVPFPSPPVMPQVFSDAIQNLIDLNSLADSPAGSTNDRNQRDIVRSTIYEYLVTDGIYVLSIANTKETYEEKKAVVELAGYTVANDTHNPVEKLPVTGLSVNVPTMPGVRTIQARWKKGKCEAFIVQGTMGPVTANSQWEQLCVSSRAKCEVTLEPGQWAVRVIGLYSSGEAAPSNPVLFMLG